VSKQSNVVRKYFKEVKSHLSCSWSERNGFVNYIKDQLDDNVLTDENITKEKLVEILGEPEIVAKGFDSVNQKELRVRAKVCSLSMLLAIALAVIAVLLAVILIFELYHLGGNTLID
jgi:hypothetical protein